LEGSHLHLYFKPLQKLVASNIQTHIVGVESKFAGH